MSGHFCISENNLINTFHETLVQSSNFNYPGGLGQGMQHKPHSNRSNKESLYGHRWCPSHCFPFIDIAALLYLSNYFSVLWVKWVCGIIGHGQWRATIQLTQWNLVMKVMGMRQRWKKKPTNFFCVALKFLSNPNNKPAQTTVTLHTWPGFLILGNR